MSSPCFGFPVFLPFRNLFPVVVLSAKAGSTLPLQTLPYTPPLCRADGPAGRKAASPLCIHSSDSSCSGRRHAGCQPAQALLSPPRCPYPTCTRQRSVLRLFLAFALEMKQLVLQHRIKDWKFRGKGDRSRPHKGSKSCFF